VNQTHIMFYAHFVLSKKGPLARIWLAAHWDKKLTKAHVFETNIEGSVDAIIQPKVKLALRTSGHLLLGVVRIYSRKAKYLLADCNEAFVKIKMAFRPGVVDLPEENREAAVSTITLPETFHDFDTTMADLTDLDVQAQFAVNQSRPEEITMREDLGNITLVGDDGFGDMGFDGGSNIIQDAHMDDSLYVRNDDASSLLLDSSAQKSSGDKGMDIDLHAQPRDGGFGDGMADFDPPGVDDDDDDSDNDNFGGGVDDDLFGENFEGGGLFEEPPVPEVPLQAEQEALKDAVFGSRHVPRVPDDITLPATEQTTTIVPDQTTLIPNEAEAFALEPIDVTSMGTERKAKRKRKLIIDDQKGIPSESMKVQLSDTSEITTTLDLAPPTKKLKYWKETGGVEKLFALPGRPIVSRRICRMFNRNLITKPMLDTEVRDDTLDLGERIPELPELSVHDIPVEPDHDLTAREMARDAETSRIDQILDEVPSVLDPPSLLEDPHHRSSLATTSRLEDSLAGGRTPMMERAHYRHDDSEEEEDVDDVFGNELPPAEMEQDTTLQEDNNVDAEELEEKRWSRRTQQMMHVINKNLKSNSTASFVEMTARNNRKQVASKFYTLLVLKKMQAIEVEQSRPYGDISIIHGPKMDLVF